MDKQDLTELLQNLNVETTKKLDISNKDIKEIPAEIARLKNLEYLNISYNNLEELPLEISSLPNLKTLLVARNYLTKLPPSITRLNDLSVLDISFNEIEELPQNLENWENLVSLDLSYNRLKRLPIDFTKLHNLRDVNLDENPFEFPPQKVIKRGLYATMYYLAEEKKRVSASKINIQVYNLPLNVRAPFRDFLECFNMIISEDISNRFQFEVNYINTDTDAAITFDVKAEEYLYDFVYFIKENVNTLKEAPSKRPDLSLFESQVRELKKQIIDFNDTLLKKMIELKEIQSRINHLVTLLE